MAFGNVQFYTAIMMLSPLEQVCLFPVIDAFAEARQLTCVYKPLHLHLLSVCPSFQHCGTLHIHMRVALSYACLQSCCCLVWVCCCKSYHVFLLRFVEPLVFKVLAEMLDGVEGADEDMQYQHMFSQWLRPQPGITVGNCDETYHIVESLLDVTYPGLALQSLVNNGRHPWQMSSVDAVGSMKVIRVSDVKKSGRHFFAMLESFLQQTAHANSSGPAWSGMVEADQQGSFPGLSYRPRTHWYLFAVIKDFSQDEASKKLQQNVPAWFLRRQLCCIHPVTKASPEVSAAAYSAQPCMAYCPLVKLANQSASSALIQS